MQYLTCVLKRVVVLVFMFVAENQVYAINNGNEAQDKDQPEGATAMTPQLRFYDPSKVESNYGVYLLEYDHSEIDVRGIPLPDSMTFEYSLPPESVIHIHVVSSDDNEMVGEDTGEVVSIDFDHLFVVISTREASAGLPQTPASSGRQSVVGFMQVAPGGDRTGADEKRAELLLAPDWESLIVNLKDWEVDSLIMHLEVDINIRRQLSSLFCSEHKSDNEECRKRLITLLNKLIEELPESVCDNGKTASTSEAVPELSPEPPPGCLCADDEAENRTTSIDR